MLTAELKQGGSYSFKILKEQSQNKFFRVKTDDGEEFKILKFKFQLNQTIPDEIQCYVKSLYPLTLSQDISVHISNFYNEGEEYSFIVKDHLREDSSQYELKDEHGLCFKLSNSPVPLTKGTRVRCKILKIKDAYVNLKYVGSLGTKFSLEFHSIEKWLNLLNLRQEYAGFYKKLLESIPELHPALIKYENKVPGWTLDLLQICTTHIPEWLVACRDDLKKLRKICDRLEIGRRLALYMVQESDFLRACSNEHRHLLQGRISNYVELFEQYHQAAEKILDKTHEEYIDRMFRRLKNSGYLYMPSVQIRIMMTILKLRPELINSRMGELFEALHNWDISNWESEPFRAALVEQLQLFIEENSGKINNLPANDSSQDNKVIVRMILAIAIQRILANESDNIDLNLNRANLYRYISYLNPSEVNNLLDKGICSLLGIEWPNEYTWNDTENPTLLFVKSSFPLSPDEERNMITKSYITSKVELHLSPTKIHLIGTGADADSTVLPNNMFDWMDPIISTVDPINFPNTKKSKDLKALSQVWSDISWSLFGGSDSSVERIEKRFPDEGDETMVVIDDVRIVDSGHEKQRLQFHCTIHDDSLMGEGWMPADTIHMIGWLSYKDIPSNYDGSLSFTLNEEGEPLLFPATVHIKPDGSLAFSMKRQIEEHLLENHYPGKESVAIVTYLDRINNAWLCLSETGATYKVACDDSTENLSEGMLVRVRYIEQDRSLSTPQFFIGELSTDQENIPSLIKKSECLSNLMQGLGVKDDQELPYQVMESTQIMSKEELEELIFILQRRAFSETEYIKAYNYLGLATLLCRLAENKRLENEISVHMKLLEFLQEFSRNRRLDYDVVDAFESQVQNSPMLERLYTRIKIVSDLDSNHNTPGLWDIYQNPRNEIEGKLASLVLSYNMLPKELEDSRKQILNEISNLLNINNALATSKYYGDESQTIEFKSSLVFSSKSGSRPDPKGQMHEITHIICGFMNARGGKLFIGVNDSGYENGLDDDLTYRRNRGEKANIDGLIVDLQNHLDRTLPTHAKDHWEISSDPESKKGVIIVDVKPVRQPVELDGVIYVRASSTTKPRLGEEKEEFIKSREHNYDILMALWGISNLQQGDVNDREGDDQADYVDHKSEEISEKNETEEEILESSSENSKEEINTGKHRKNILHDYEENFVTPAFYLYFNPNDSFYTSGEDLYIDHYNNLDECRLALAVKDNEKNANLIYTFQDGKVGKVPMQDITSILPKQIQKFSKEEKLIAINIGEENDYLLSVIKAPNRSLYYRLDKVGKLEMGTINNEKVQKLCTLNHKLMRQEIIKPDKMTFFDKEAIDRDSNFFGVSVPVGDGTLTDEERIDVLLKPIVEE
ncbi:MAG: ATP-binding protein [Muribaculaceae bacterium]|nr:ATP-binding protein [Muribaculaceae bacterium]